MDTVASNNITAESKDHPPLLEGPTQNVNQKFVKFWPYELKSRRLGDNILLPDSE